MPSGWHLRQRQRYACQCIPRPCCLFLSLLIGGTRRRPRGDCRPRRLAAQGRLLRQGGRHRRPYAVNHGARDSGAPEPRSFFSRRTALVPTQPGSSSARLQRFLYTLSNIRASRALLKPGSPGSINDVSKESESVNAQTKNQSREPISNACPGERPRHTGTLCPRASWTHQKRCVSAARSHGFGDLSHVGVS